MCLAGICRRSLPCGTIVVRLWGWVIMTFFVVNRVHINTNRVFPKIVTSKAPLGDDVEPNYFTSRCGRGQYYFFELKCW